MKIKNDKSFHLHNKLLNLDYIKKHLEEIKKHHKESYQHSLRVGLLCIDLAYENNFSEKAVILAGESGLLHDIGKTEIPHKILSKKDCLEENEKERINEHPRYAFIKMNGNEYEKIRRVCIAHHEYKTGKYPRRGTDRRKKYRPESVERRKGDAYIDKVAEIVAIADMFDALTERRVYKKQFKKDEVLDLLKKQFLGDEKFIDQVMSRMGGTLSRKIEILFEGSCA